jgi:GntR family transcriptional regulator/MocR family aminotransferase
LELAAQHRVAILEDDVDGEYSFGEAHSRSLLSLDTRGQVVFIGSLSRLLAPGIRLGFLVAPPELAVRLARLRKALEWQGDRVLEWAVADLIRDGELSRHLRKTRKIYEQRRDLISKLLASELGTYLTVQASDGGLSLWLRSTGAQALAPWISAARSLGLVLQPPEHFYIDPPEEAFRLGFAHLDEGMIQDAVGRLKHDLVQAAKG